MELVTHSTLFLIYFGVSVKCNVKPKLKSPLNTYSELNPSGIDSG